MYSTSEVQAPTMLPIFIPRPVAIPMPGATPIAAGPLPWPQSTIPQASASPISAAAAASIRRLGASDVVGVDFSARMVAHARERSTGLAGLAFRQGDAADTGLAAESRDIVFERALIHHLESYEPAFAEAHRALVPGGHLIVQDRTPANIRGRRESAVGNGFRRRPEPQPVGSAPDLRHHQELDMDLEARTGRSILHALDDAELRDLLAFIRERIGTPPVVERDRWTIWSATA